MRDSQSLLRYSPPCFCCYTNASFSESKVFDQDIADNIGTWPNRSECLPRLLSRELLLFNLFRQFALLA